MAYLLAVCSIDEVTSGFVESIKELKATFFIHVTQIWPFITNAHSTKTNRRDVNTSGRCQLSMAT